MDFADVLGDGGFGEIEGEDSGDDNQELQMFGLNT